MPLSSRWWFQRFFIFYPYLGKWSKLTNIFQMGWNHQLVMYCLIECEVFIQRVLKGFTRKRIWDALEIHIHHASYGIFYFWMKCGELVESGCLSWGRVRCLFEDVFYILHGNWQVTISLAWTFLQFFTFMWNLGIVRMAMVEWKSLCIKETCAFVNRHVLFVFFSSTSHLFGHQEKKPQRTKIISLPWKLTSISPQKIGWVWKLLSFPF